MHPARLVVDVEHAAANHHRDKHRQRQRPRQQIFHVFDVGIKLDNGERGLLQNARLDRRLVQRGGQVAEFRLNRRTHKIVAVIHHHRDLRMVVFVDTPGKLRGNNHRAFKFAVAHIFHSLLLAVVINRHECADVRPHRIKRLADPQRLRAAILIDNRHPRVANLSPKSIAQNDQLHQRHNH